jgi:hypothetical protein
MKRDAEQKGGSLESGTCHKQKIGEVGGMDAQGKNEKPRANPSTSAPRGHTIK